MVFENDLIKYRLVRLLLTAWTFSILAHFFIAIHPNMKPFAVVVMLLSLVASGKLVFMLFYNSEKITQLGLIILSILAILIFSSNCISLLSWAIFGSSPQPFKTPFGNNTIWPPQHTSLSQKKQRSPPKVITIQENEEKPDPPPSKQTFRPLNSVHSKTTKQTKVPPEKYEAIKRFIASHLKSLKEKGFKSVIPNYTPTCSYNHLTVEHDELEVIITESNLIFSPVNLDSPKGLNIYNKRKDEWVCEVPVDYLLPNGKKIGSATRVYLIRKDKKGFKIANEYSILEKAIE